MSVIGLKALGLGSYRTAWLALHKLRKAMVCPRRECLSGVIEVDETFLGGERPGKRGRGADGKILVLIAAEHVERISDGYVLSTSKMPQARRLRTHCPRWWPPGSTITTDGWSGYAGLVKADYGHEVVRSFGKRRGESASSLPSRGKPAEAVDHGNASRIAE